MWPAEYVAALDRYKACTRDIERQFRICESLLTQSCLEKKVRSFKAIRLSMDYMESMIQQEPNLKIIYLVRDPRGILASRQSISEMSHMSGGNLTKEAQALCQRMDSDFEEFQDIKKKFPDNIIMIKYEQLAVESMKTAEHIYQFTRSISLPLPVREFLGKSLASSRDGRREDPYGTARKNGSVSVEKWKRALSGEDILHIDKVCANVIKNLDYWMY